MTRVCVSTGCCPALSISLLQDRQQNNSCRTSLIGRCCLFGEQRRWHSAFESRRRKGLDDAKRQVRAGLQEILHNQVLVSSTVAGVSAQLVKPFTSVILGRGFNWKLIVKSGGMPSSHSASVAAVTTVLGLERGLADSFFGFAFVMASLVMYDAQGVRRSVGKQAEVINTIVLTNMVDSGSSQAWKPSQSASNPSRYAIGVELARDPVQAELAFMEEADASPAQAPKSTAVLSKGSSLRENDSAGRSGKDQIELNGATKSTQTYLEEAEKLPSVREGQVTLQEIGSLDGWKHIPLKESVGHTKLEVFVGAVWGILMALVLHPIIQ